MARKGFGIDVKFFSRLRGSGPLKREVFKRQATPLKRIGAFVRQRARSSIRYRKYRGDKTRHAAPGRPPFSHTRDRFVTLRNILFFAERNNQSVIIGPIKLNGHRGTIPGLHEFGGVQRIREKQNRDGTWRPYGRRQARPGVRTRRRRARYAPRPFMGPALEQEVSAGTIPKAWRGTVRT